METSHPTNESKSANVEVPTSGQHFGNALLDAVTFPKRNTKFKLADFFQVEVDEFHQGVFLFLSAKKVKTTTDSKLFENIEFVDEYGWVISTYCYSSNYYYKIFICQYRAKPWHNNYHIRSYLAGINGCDGYTVVDTIEDFVDWMEVHQ